MSYFSTPATQDTLPKEANFFPHQISQRKYVNITDDRNKVF